MTIFPFNEELADSERRSVLERTLHAALRGGAISQKSLVSSIRRAEAEALQVPARTFVLASHVSFVLRSLRAAPRIGNIRVVRHLPRHFSAQRTQSAIASEEGIVDNYTALLTTVEARTIEQAFDIALNELDLLRGLWNYALSSHMMWVKTSDPTSPIGRIRFSRIHTLHEPAGDLATNRYWFHPEFRQQDSTSLSDSDWRRMQKFVHTTRRRLAGIAYRVDIERAFIHYVRALDATDMEAAFLKLWSVLEQISAAGGERYDTLIDRAAFLFTDVGITRYFLEHLRYQRNQIVHLGTPQSELRPLVYQTKQFVDKMLAVHVQLGSKFASLQEAGQFMNFGHDRKALKRRVWLIRRALAFLG